MNYNDLILRLRDVAERRADDRRVAEFGPGGGNPSAKASDHYEWIAADAIQELQKDAMRYRWLRDLKCNQLHVQHDDHACNYVTAKQHIEENDPTWFGDCDPLELQKMKDTNSIWCIQIYPHTPIGFNVYHGATLDTAIDEAMQHEA